MPKSYCPSCQKEKERFGICNDCIRVRDTRIEKSEKHIQDKIMQDTDHGIKIPRRTF